jgi:hypothetical protein
MTEGKTGLWEKLFGGKKSCCAVQIEPLDGAADSGAGESAIAERGAQGDHGDGPCPPAGNLAPKGH